MQNTVGNMTFVTQSAAVVKGYEKQSINAPKRSTNMKSKPGLGAGSVTNKLSSHMLLKEATNDHEGIMEVKRAKTSAQTCEINT